jgi:hypothetical protein
MSSAHAEYQELCRHVKAVWTRRRNVTSGIGVCHLLTGFLGPLLVALGLDRFLPLPGIVRAAAILASISLMLYFLIRGVVLPWIQRQDLFAGARFIESRRPELNTSFITALQVREDLDRDPPWFDRQMVEATLRFAGELARRLDLGSVVDTRPLRRAAALAAVLLAAAIGYAAWDFAQLRAQLGRFLTAFSEVRDDLTSPVEREILVEVIPDGKTTVLRGASVTLQAALVGFTSPRVKLRLQPENGLAEEYELDTSGGQTAGHTLVSVEASFDAVFSAETVTSEPVTIRVVERPEVVNVQLECIYPAYVRRPPLRLPRSSGEISALKGSHIVLTIEASRALQSGHLEVLRGQAVPLAVGGRFARGVFSVEETIEYRIRLVSIEGFENEKPETRLIQVVHDLPPEVQFVNLGIEPEGEVQLKESLATAKALEVVARDDYGIRKIVLHYDIEAVVKELSHEPVRGKQKSRVFAIPAQNWTGLLARVGELGLKVGDRISFRAEVMDWYDREEDGKPHATRTPTYHLVVVGEEFAWEDVVYRPDETMDFGLYDTLARKARGREKPPRESIAREPRIEMPGVELDLPYGHDEVPIRYQSAWKAYTTSLME